VRSHVDEDLAVALDISCLDHKTFLRLHSSATFRIDYWVSIFIDGAGLLLLSEYFEQFWRVLALFKLLRKFLKLFRSEALHAWRFLSHWLLASWAIIKRIENA